MNIEEFHDKLNNIESEITKLYEKKQELLSTCTHPKTRVDTRYYEGGYDYYASTTVKVICNVCGKTISKEEVEHRWR